MFELHTARAQQEVHSAAENEFERLMCGANGRDVQIKVISRGDRGGMRFLRSDCKHYGFHSTFSAAQRNQ